MTHKALIRQLQISCLGLDPIDPLRLLVDDVIAALAQPEQQEPVAWMKPHEKCDRACMYLCTKGFTQFPECASLQRTWVGLTDEDVNGFVGQYWGDEYMKMRSMVRAIEAKLKELNT